MFKKIECVAVVLLIIMSFLFSSCATTSSTATTEVEITSKNFYDYFSINYDYSGLNYKIEKYLLLYGYSVNGYVTLSIIPKVELEAKNVQLIFSSKDYHPEYMYAGWTQTPETVSISLSIDGTASTRLNYEYEAPLRALAPSYDLLEKPKFMTSCIEKEYSGSIIVADSILNNLDK